VEVITSAAIRYKQTVYRGKNHAECIVAAHKATGDKPIRGEQGFTVMDRRVEITPERFVDRREAKKIARRSGQLAYSRVGDELFSEDINRYL
jgi:hypothetical protein